jgi:hypothetical protein
MRNCNPLNIRRVAGTRWKGQSAEQNDPQFVQFESMEWGVRAALKIFETYANKYKAVCIEDIITRWAPPTENDTRKYISDLCRLTGFGGKERLTENDWPKLVKAMARIECGAVLSEDVILKGFRLFKGMKTAPL